MSFGTSGFSAIRHIGFFCHSYVHSFCLQLLISFLKSDIGGCISKNIEILGEDDEEEPMNIESGVELSHSEDDLSENEREIHEDMNDIDYCTKILLSNARSLAPKIMPLIDCMSELKCDFTMITEMWFRGGKKLDSELTNIKGATGINIICKNQWVGNRGGATGEGVAIAVNTGKCNLKKRVLKSKHEIVCVVGKIGKIERRFAIYSVYVPPSTKAGYMSHQVPRQGTSLSCARTLQRPLRRLRAP